jgi:GntR family transcriptional regulator, galactonate operon transcriptional repressor
VHRPIKGRANRDIVLPQSRLYPSKGLHGQVTHALGRRIASGDWAEGERIPDEAALAEAYGVSRQGVREALKVLAAKGLVVSRRRAGTRVLPRDMWNLLDADVLAWHPLHAIPAKTVADLFELRQLLEPLAAARAAGRGDRDEIARIGAALHTLESAEPFTDSFYAADLAFHLAICQASGNGLVTRLSRILMPLCDSIGRMRRPEHGAVNLATRRALYEAIKRGDVAAAQKALAEIVEEGHPDRLDRPSRD